MSSYLYLEFDNRILSVSKTICEQNEYLSSIKDIETSRTKPFFVDRNYDLANEIITAYRYNDLNMLSEEGLYELGIWNTTNIYDESNSQIIELEVGGQIFKTTKGTLMKCTYYYMLFSSNNDYVCEPLDMNPEAFKHILNFARNKKYKLDIGKYHHEIIFLGVNINEVEFTEIKENKVIGKNQEIKNETIVTSNFHNNIQDSYTLEPQIYLTGNPSVTFAKQVYNRHTEFGMVNSCIDKQTINGKYYEKQFTNVNNVMSLFMKINGYESADDVYNLIENVNITISGVEFINLSGEGVKCFYNCLKKNMDKSNGLTILLNYGAPIPVFILDDKSMKIKIKFKENIDSDVSIGIRYMVLKTQYEINKFLKVSHEYLFRNSVEHTMSVTENQKKTFNFSNNMVAEFIYFIMPNQTCDIKGVMTSGNDTYIIDKYHSHDVMNLIYQNNLPNNVYMCTSNIAEGSQQPCGNIVLKKNDKIEIVPNFTGKLVIVISYFNILRVMSGNMYFAYNDAPPVDEIQEQMENINYEISTKMQKITSKSYKFN